MSISGRSEDQPPPYIREPHPQLKYIEDSVGDRVDEDSDIRSDTTHEDRNRGGGSGFPPGPSSSTHRHRQSNFSDPLDTSSNYNGPQTRVSHPSYPDPRAQKYHVNGYPQQIQSVGGGRDYGYDPDRQIYEPTPGRGYGTSRGHQRYQGSFSGSQFVLYGQDIETGHQACNGERRRHRGRCEGGLLQRRRERKDSRDGGGGRLAGRGLVGGLLGRAGDSLSGITGRK